MNQIDRFILPLEDFKSLLLTSGLSRLFNFFAKWEEIDQFYGDEIHAYLSKLGPLPEMNRIRFWDSFCLTNKSFDSEFKTLLCKNYNVEDILILSMEGKLFKVKFNDFDNFINDIYPASYNMDFYQPEDFFFINCTLRKIQLIHHSGYWIDYRDENY